MTKSIAGPRPTPDGNTMQIRPMLIPHQLIRCDILFHGFIYQLVQVSSLCAPPPGCGVGLLWSAKRKCQFPLQFPARCSTARHELRLNCLNTLCSRCSSVNRPPEQLNDGIEAGKGRRSPGRFQAAARVAGPVEAWTAESAVHSPLSIILLRPRLWTLCALKGHHTLDTRTSGRDYAPTHAGGIYSLRRRGLLCSAFCLFCCSVKLNGATFVAHH